MRRRKMMTLLAVTASFPIWVMALPVAGQPAPSPDVDETARRLIHAYPQFLERRDGNALVWRDGKRMTIDDGRGAKTPAARLDAPDLKDMLTTPYPIGGGAAADV